MLVEQDPPELSEAGGRIVECSKDALPVFDRQRQDHNVRFQGTFEHGGGRLVDEIGQFANDEIGQFANEISADGNPGESHRGEAK